MTIEFKDVLVQIPSYIFWKDKNSIFLGCNENFAIAAGLKSPQEIIGKTDYELYWGDSHAGCYQQGDVAVLDGVSKINVIESLLQSNNTLVKIRITKVPLLDKNKQKIGIIGSFTNELEIKNQGKVSSLSPTISLSNNQINCLLFLVKGLTAKQIADQMSLSKRTVEAYLEAIKIKLNCNSKSSLIAKALTFDFVKHELFSN